MARYELAEVNAMDQPLFVGAFGWTFEHSPWVAAQAWATRPFATLDALHAAMVAAVQQASPEAQLDLIRAHPDLGQRLGRASLSGASATEQAGLGLDRLSDEEFERFHALNTAYRERFGFPFIVAVRQHSRASILVAFAQRLTHDADTERAIALAEIAEIARFRLQDTIR